MWGEPIQGILHTVAHATGQGTHYISSATLAKLELRHLGLTESVLLFRQEYINTFESLNLKSPMGRTDSVIVTGHPGIGMSFPLHTSDLAYVFQLMGQARHLSYITSCFTG
jgi:hypothetical protein